MSLSKFPLYDKNVLRKNRQPLVRIISSVHSSCIARAHCLLTQPEETICLRDEEVDCSSSARPTSVDTSSPPSE
ncbi:unnamed protein product [Gongylonema pulchrum]|uniref:Uncharacterized protein n=1 Tax=Gongylonema pulchrum TaxID=637853 RepID=A0A183ETI5_9BILA|nr:unnamed protein product [Gongylonema pulchrum]